MILTCLASGSSGNCYALKDSKGKILLLDAGIPIMKIKKGCSWKVSDIVGCVVTHKHRDHSEAVSDLEEWESQSTNLTKITPISVAMANLELYQFR